MSLWVALVSLCSAGPGLNHPEVRVFGPQPASRIVLDKVWHSIVQICSASMAKCWQSPFPAPPKRVWPLSEALSPRLAPRLPHQIHHFITLLHITSAVAVFSRLVVQFSLVLCIEKLWISYKKCCHRHKAVTHLTLADVFASCRFSWFCFRCTSSLCHKMKLNFICHKKLNAVRWIEVR